MGLFNFLQKKAKWNEGSYEPYNDSGINFIYNLLFCDNIEVLKKKTAQPYTYPMDVLFSESYSPGDIKKIIDDDTLDIRYRILAYNQQLANGEKPATKELLAVIVEIGKKQGLDVLASFKNGTGRYINYTGKMIFWEAADDTCTNLTNKLFAESEQIIGQIGPWDKERRPCPTAGNMRITFLVSDGLYFGEAPVNVLFKDAVAGPAINTASALMRYMIELSLKNQHPQNS